MLMETHHVAFTPPAAAIPDQWPNSRPVLYWRMLRNYIDCWPKRFYEDLVVDCAPQFPRTLFISDPIIVRAVLRNANGVFQPTWQQSRICRALFGGPTIATSIAEEWAQDRDIYEHAVAASRVTDFCGTIHENAQSLTSQWDNRPSIASIGPTVSAFALRNIAHFALSWRPSPILDALAGDLSAHADRIGQVSLGGFLRAAAFLPGSSRGGRARPLARMEALIRSDLAMRKISGNAGTDLLGGYLRMQAKRRGDGVSDQRISANVMALLASGYDTTASALSWLLYLLSLDTKIQAVVREELAPLAERGGMPQLKRSSVTRMVLQEVLRLYPPLPLLGRKALRDTEIAGRRIAAGTTVFMSTYVMHRHRALWSDPDSFDPFRFSAARRQEHVEGAYLPFGSGQRSCVGAQLAQLEVLIFAAHVLQGFILNANPDDPVLLRSGLGLRASGGMKLRLQPIV